MGKAAERSEQSREQAAQSANGCFGDREGLAGLQQWQARFCPHRGAVAIGTERAGREAVDAWVSPDRPSH